MSDTVRFIHEFRLDDAPPAVVRHAKRFLLDLIGVAAAGSRLDASRILRRTALTLFSAGQGGSRFLFDGQAASPAGAALVNAGTIDAFDAHDGHPLTKGHAGCGALAGLLAFGDCSRAGTGAAALADLIVAYEVALRAGIAMHRTVADYHTSGAWVALGVAALGARSMRLGRQATREALGIAEYHGPRSQMMRCIDHPTMVKDGSGWGAMAGVTAACLAREGFTGAPAITVEGEAVEEYWRDLGERWRIAEQYMKPYPVCRWAQPAMEAVAQLRRDHQFAAGAIESITVTTFSEATRLAVRSPGSTDAAQYSLPFPVAALLVRGRLGPAEVESVVNAFPAVTESAAIGVPDPVKGQAVVVFAVLDPREDADEEALRAQVVAALTAQLGKPLKPKAVLFVGALPALAEGGTVIIAAELSEGLGGPEFSAMLQAATDHESFMAQILSPAHTFCKDQWEVEMLCRVLRRGDVIVVSDQVSAETLEDCLVGAAPTVEAAVERALAKHGADAALIAIPSGPYCIPVQRQPVPAGGGR